jgi:NADH:ubiquinone oxidoreductase subunit C
MTMETLQEKTQKALDIAKGLLEEFVMASSTPEENRLDVMVSPDKLLPAIEKLQQNNWGYLSTITGLDHPGAAESKQDESRWEKSVEEVSGSAYDREGTIELLYHFSEGAAITTLRVSVPYSKAVVPSVCGIIPSANLYEMETIEMFGVKIENTPSEEHLLLPDGWPENTYPLRKSFTGLKELPHS